MPGAKAQDRVNDFVVKIATVNGTGSASANGLLMKAIFRSGVPVVGKNYFPSNIQGLPTWYEIRVTRDAHRARAGHVDIMVALNAETYARDLAELASGGYFIYDSTWPRAALLKRDDVTVIGVPLARLCNDTFQGVRTRILMKNICYAGVLAALCDLDLELIRALLAETYAKKPKLLDANMKAIQLGYDYAREHVSCPLPLRVEKMDATAGHIIIDGNTAAALGCVYAGATVGAWYPITPSTSLMDAYKSFCEKLRIDAETGRKNYIMIQAEDELASIGMVIGASWNGARAFTATSGPGMSLMQEFLGLGLLRRGAGRGVRHPARRTFDRHADAHAAGRPAIGGLCLARRYAAGVPVSGQSRGMLRVRRQGVRSGRAAADAGAGAVRSRYRHERLDVPGLQMGSRAISPTAASCSTPSSCRRSTASGATTITTMTASRSARCRACIRRAPISRAARVIRSTAPTPRIRRNTRWWSTGCARNGSPPRASCPSRSSNAARSRPKSASSRSAAAMPRCARRACGWARKPYTPIICGCAAFRSAMTSRQFLQAHRINFVVEQNRDAQLRSLLIMETGIEKSRLRSILHYNGMPIPASYVYDGVARVITPERPAAQLVG